MRAVSPLPLLSFTSLLQNHRSSSPFIAAPERALRCLSGQRTRQKSLAAMNGHTWRDSLDKLVSIPQAEAPQAVVYSAGGGGHFFKWLFSTPGASAVFLEGAMPYARHSTERLLQRGRQTVPSNFVDAEMARALSRSALQCAMEIKIRESGIQALSDRLVGIGSTCALASTQPKRGEHRVYVCATSLRGGRHSTREYAAILEKGRRSREEEDELVSRVLLNALLDQADVDRVPTGLDATGASPGNEELSESSDEAQDPIQDLLDGKVTHVVLCGGSGLVVPSPPLSDCDILMLPGSFNPLHEGHIGMAEAAANLRGTSMSRVVFELSCVNADKPTISLDEIHRRAAQFRERGLHLLLSSAPLFTQKAALVRGVTFIVGMDTFVRIINPKYYGGTDAGVAKALTEMRSHRAHFLVAGRTEGGAFLRLGDVTHDEGKFDGVKGMSDDELSDLFQELPDFRVDISSTELRARIKDQKRRGLTTD
ncbi:unnamed protein product [Vitrella brassicaformis CCMP3155]|uniref:Cytidyltransferase-like domain-containing protein n=1 Tax=Vitrella brassicaformis (strain CCMP3155) TaxID=1169540 RepID=A0A0G4EQI1_VITBC|nr:unnamed protein product [Vitrella brassicaformis CCMP3155]|mmetsp:Transcript_12393/g.36016  ORF Transcript_12393/g.36016 Transcript_12393/m.36016 type:complete len:481 (+) Transcript_12393:82-1524(+)|eukprot:CEL99726.1 unnamed protein product [Vitrella brassicaformis CCMP3155]